MSIYFMLSNPIFYAINIVLRYPFAFIVTIFDFIFSVGFSFIPSYIIKNIITCMTKGNDFPIFMTEVRPYIIFYLFFFFISIFVFRLYDYVVLVKTFPIIKRNIVVENFSYILQHSKTFFQKYLFGDITEKIDNLQKNVIDMLDLLFTKILVNITSITASTAILLYFNFSCGIVIITWTVFFILLSLIFGQKIIRVGVSWVNKMSFLNGLMVDTLSNFITVKIFNNVYHEKEIINTYAESIQKDNQTIEFYFFICWLAYAASFFIVQILCLYILFNQYKNNTINAGDFAFVWSINSSIVNVLWKLLKDFIEFPEYYSNIDQSLKVLQEPIQISSNSHNILKINHNPIIEFKNVTFCFDNKQIFNNLNITIHSGEKVGIVGLSGSGKSTFINLILRFYDIQNGQILINDTDISTITLESLYDSIAVIPQEAMLLNRTILENITYGNHHASAEMIKEAIRLAALEELLSQLPLGVNTPIGNQGSSLSGGQKQRIAIARAYLKNNASILILDEATSNLDSITEMNIQESLDTICKNKTTLIIAHRLSTLEKVNRILVFHEGKIIEDGSHNELIAHNGIYKKLWHTQNNLFNDTDKEIYF